MVIDIMAAFENEPPPLDYIWPGFLAGTVGALVAPGATGKSYWALQAAMAVACGVAGGDLVQLTPTKTGRVVYFAGEDPAPVLMHRIHAIGKHLPSTAHASISENLSLETIMGRRLNIMDARQLNNLMEYCANSRLVVLDTLSRIHKLNENSNSDMAHLVTQLEYLAASTGASILYLHHVSKGSVREAKTDQQQAARGADALVANPRWCGYIAQMSENEANDLSDHSSGHPISASDIGSYVRFGGSKHNYAEPQLDKWYKRQKGGVLVPVELRQTRSRKKRGYEQSTRKSRIRAI